MHASYVVRLILDHYSYLKPEQVHRLVHHSSFVNMRKRYLYYAVPKAACTSIKTLISRLEGNPPIKILAGRQDKSRREMFIHARENVPVPSLVDLDDAAQREVLHSPDFLRMTLVRNPFTRVLSAWSKVMQCEGAEQPYLDIRGELPGFGNKNLITLAEFISYLETQDLRTCDAHWSIQTSHIFIDAMNFNLIGKIENMADVMEQFSMWLDRPPAFAVEQRNMSVPASRGSYNSNLAERVHKLYAVDFERLGYSAEDWPAGDPSATRVFSEQKYYDEIIERNLLLSELYREVYRLRDMAERVDRLHVTKIIDALTTTRDMFRRLLK